MRRWNHPASLALATALALAAAGGMTPARSAVTPEDEDKLPVRFTAGGELTAAEDEEVRATLKSYLAAIQKRDWKTASRYIERASFVAGLPLMMAAIEPDPAKRAEAMNGIFGVSKEDELRAKSTADLFTSVMTYATAKDPESVAMMAKAKFALLGARRIKDRVHIAYQLTVPAESDTLQPYTRVTAERLRRVGKEWKIVFQHDQ